MIDGTATTDRFLCLECGHRGPAIGRLVIDTADFCGATVIIETIDDESLKCEDCGGKHIEEVGDES